MIGRYKNNEKRASWKLVKAYSQLVLLIQFLMLLGINAYGLGNISVRLKYHTKYMSVAKEACLTYIQMFFFVGRNLRPSIIFLFTVQS